MTEDITYCEKTNCNVMSCTRNQKHIRCFDIPHSFAYFEGDPRYCKKDVCDETKVKEKRNG